MSTMQVNARENMFFVLKIDMIKKESKYDDGIRWLMWIAHVFDLIMSFVDIVECEVE